MVGWVCPDARVGCLVWTTAGGARRRAGRDKGSGATDTSGECERTDSITCKFQTGEWETAIPITVACGCVSPKLYPRKQWDRKGTECLNPIDEFCSRQTDLLKTLVLLM